MTKTTRDEAEIKKFDDLADQWWDVNGKFKTLHIINPLRIKYIKTLVCRVFARGANEQVPFKGLELLDVGCGGGLISVPMNALGARVTAIDASLNNIKTAKAYAKRKSITIDFINTTAELVAKSGKKFDVILALEVIEHVSDYKLFLSELAKMLVPGGVLIISTINRTFKSLLLAKIAAEYILRMIPIGTHEWERFLRPEEIKEVLDTYGLKILDSSGMAFNPLIFKWNLTRDLSVNYFMTFR